MKTGMIHRCHRTSHLLSAHTATWLQTPTQRTYTHSTSHTGPPPG